MIIPKTRKPRRFGYQPRYYDAREDERFKRRLRFTSSTRRGRRPPFLFLAILLVLVMVVYLAL